MILWQTHTSYLLDHLGGSLGCCRELCVDQSARQSVQAISSFLSSPSCGSEGRLAVFTKWFTLLQAAGIHRVSPFAVFFVNPFLSRCTFCCVNEDVVTQSIFDV